MENKDMTGVLFMVEDRASDKHPNLTGNVTIKGEKYYISAWTNTSKNGKKINLIAIVNKTIAVPKFPEILNK